MRILDKLLNRQQITAQYWQGEWDPDPIFYSLWQPKGDELQSLPSEYLGLPLPRGKREYTFVGGSLPYRGLAIMMETPNTRHAGFVAEYWDGQDWQKTGLWDETNGLTKNGKLLVTRKPNWTSHRLAAEGKSMEAYWIRFSLINDLDPITAGWTDVIHDVPILLSPDWFMKKHRLTACENKPGLKMIYVKVLDEKGRGIYEAEVGFNTEPSHGIVYDHPDFRGLTDENGYISWDSLGIPTIYNLSIDGEVVVQNIRLDLGNEYCGVGLGSWRPVNRPGIYSYWFELRQV